MSNHKFLIVDDDQVFLDTLERALQKKSFQVVKAENPQEAIALAKASVPDFAVIDLKIGRESGLDCLQPLKKINPDMRILMLTGYSSIATAVSAIKQGAVHYACKPLGIKEILDILVEDKAPAVVPEEYPPSVDRMEWEHIQRVLDANKGNISATARSLGMHRRTLQRKLLKRPVKR